MLDRGRLVRYAVAGGLSAIAHVGTLTLLVETGVTTPVVASTIGFILSIVVSYTLQKAWVFASPVGHRRALPRFLVATMAGLLLNALTLAAGTSLLGLHYAVAQVIALVLIPVSNYVINSLWTFGAAHHAT